MSTSVLKHFDVCYAGVCVMFVVQVGAETL